MSPSSSSTPPPSSVSGRPAKGDVTIQVATSGKPSAATVGILWAPPGAPLPPNNVLFDQIPWSMRLSATSGASSPRMSIQQTDTNGTLGLDLPNGFTPSPSKPVRVIAMAWTATGQSKAEVAEFSEGPIQVGLEILAVEDSVSERVGWKGRLNHDGGSLATSDYEAWFKAESLSDPRIHQRKTTSTGEILAFNLLPEKHGLTVISGKWGTTTIIDPQSASAPQALRLEPLAPLSIAIKEQEMPFRLAGADTFEIRLWSAVSGWSKPMESETRGIFSLAIPPGAITAQLRYVRGETLYLRRADVSRTREGLPLPPDFFGGASIRGRLVDGRGQPRNDIALEIQPKDRPIETVLTVVTTNAQGEFDAGGLPRGQYEISFEDSGDVLAQFSVEDGNLDLGELGFSVETAFEMGRVEGQILDPSGQPLEEVEVEVGGETEETDEEGRFFFELDPDEMPLVARKDALVTLKPIHFTLKGGETKVLPPITLQEGAVIRGKIVFPPGRLATLTGTMDRDVDLWSESLSYPAPSGEIEDDGTFVIAGLIPGKYEVWIRSLGIELPITVSIGQPNECEWSFAAANHRLALTLKNPPRSERASATVSWPRAGALSGGKSRAKVGRNKAELAFAAPGENTLVVAFRPGDQTFNGSVEYSRNVMVASDDRSKLALEWPAAHSAARLTIKCAEEACDSWELHGPGPSGTALKASSIWNGTFQLDRLVPGSYRLVSEVSIGDEEETKREVLEFKLVAGQELSVDVPSVELEDEDEDDE